MGDPAVRRPSLLLVDDQPINIKVLARALEDLAEIRFATSGAEALRLARGDPRPDLVLLDLLMPDLDGFEVCRRLGADPATADIPVILVTALDDGSSEERGLGAGAIDYLHKPINPALVRARVGLHIERLALRRSVRELLDPGTPDAAETRRAARALLGQDPPRR